MSTIEENGTYKITLDAIPVNSALKINSKIDPLDIWHRRLGHQGRNSLNLLKNGLAEGPDSPPEKQSSSCETCKKSKQTRASFPKGEAHRATEIVEIIHTDICEVTDDTTYENERYFATFTDDKTRYTIVALVKSKTEVFEKFKQYKTLAEKHTGKYIKILRSYNGGEYINGEFNEFLRKEGILRQLSVAHTPEQERANRTLFDKTRALLKEAGLSSKHWGEALKTAVYLKNVSPTKAVEGTVPFQAWTGKKPDLKDLKIFGCGAYVHVTNKISKKLGDRS